MNARELPCFSSFILRNLICVLNLNPRYEYSVHTLYSSVGTSRAHLIYQLHTESSSPLLAIPFHPTKLP